MEHLDTRWTAVEPGVMALPTTKFRIIYVAGSAVPFRAEWDGKPIPASAHFTLAVAQAAVEQNMAELIAMGFEV
jgi:hypothetical protein